MSVEQLLLLLLFIGLPLFERLARHLRQRAAGLPAEGEPAPAPERAVPPSIPPLVASIPPLVAVNTRRTAPGPMPRETPRVVRRDRVRPAVMTATDLRRAVVLMTILGPCRALDRTDGR